MCAAALAAGAVLAGAALPPPAEAHARLLRTSPVQAAELDRSPARAGLLFDEPVRATGRPSLSGGGLERPLPLRARLERGGRLVSVALPARLGRGVYAIRWTIVSDDGHREAGALTFGIGAKAKGVSASASEKTQADALLTFARWVFVLGVLAAAGLAGVRLALRPVLSGWARDGGPALGTRPLAGALALAAVGAALELAAVPAALGTRFGVVTAAAGALALVGALASSRSLTPRAGQRVSAGLASGLVVAPALAGHALSPGRSSGAVLPIELVHACAAAAWLGAVLWLGMLVAAAVKPGAAGVPVAAAARRLSPVAAAAVGVVGVTGILRAALELQRWGQLGSTGYGRLLLVKTAVFLGLVAFGGWSHARLLKRLPSGAAVASLRRTVAAEAVLLAAVAGVVAALGSTSPPHALAAAPVSAVTSVLGRQADELAVGIRASRAGDEVAIDATVLGRDGTGAGGLRVDVAEAAARPRWSPARPCGDGRYCAHVRSSARAPRLVVRVRRRSGRASTVSITLPASPQPARAAALVAAEERALRSLHTVVIAERLASDSTHGLRTTWHVVAPDRLSYTTRVAGEAVVIGTRRWDRADAAARWLRSSQDPRLRLPALDWDRVEDPSLLGSGTVAGRPVWLVSFGDPTVPAWFEVAIDRRTQRPLVVRMVAAGHFMIRRYERFNAPLRIRPPAAAR
ncbi:copper resistance CopC/CopD family protein [Candidatus Solirubrobacter pratensis]|uniref:copper resistance CopC/CopD family protein n=1 Tax=Candidatus Solirubrobacter pratensis TaxID=1298857 RepID=UPI000488AFC1|nr:CopD family protein [Candidatus Solirubrobacter pratensis]